MSRVVSWFWLEWEIRAYWALTITERFCDALIKAEKYVKYIHGDLNHRMTYTNFSYN